MSDAWISKIAEINQRTGVEPNSPVPVDNITQAFTDAGISEEDQAKILAGFMATVDVKPADVKATSAAVAAPAKLTLAQIMDMAGDPSKAEQLKAAMAALSDADKQALIPQVQALKPADAATPTPTSNSSTPTALRQYKTGDIVTAKNSQRYQRIENPATKQIQWKNLATNKLMALPVAKQLGLNESMNSSDSRVVDVRPLIKKALAKK
jgi:hypothetical protein